LKDVLLRPALYDALKKSTDRDNLIYHIKEQFDTPPYPVLRGRIADIFDELDQKEGDKRIKSILKEINRYLNSKSIFDFLEDISFSIPTPFGIPAPEIKIPLGLFMPSKSAFRRIVKQFNNDDYNIRLTKIFREFDLDKL